MKNLGDGWWWELHNNVKVRRATELYSWNSMFYITWLLPKFKKTLKKKKVFEIESALSSGWERATYVTDYQMFNIKCRHSYWLIIGQVLRISSRMLWNIILHEASLRRAAEQQWNESGMDFDPLLVTWTNCPGSKGSRKRGKRGAGSSDCWLLYLPGVHWPIIWSPWATLSTIWMWGDFHSTLVKGRLETFDITEKV